MEQVECERLLRLDNARTPEIQLKIYAAALLTYIEASANVAANGAICSHPRTGSPIENPYLKVRAQQGAIIGKMNKIKSESVLKEIESHRLTVLKNDTQISKNTGI